MLPTTKLAFLLLVSISSTCAVLPVGYEIILQPNLENLTFNAQVIVEILPENDTTQLTFHSDNLQIDDLLVEQTNGETIESTVNTDDQLTIEFQEPLQADLLYKIYINYTGEIGTQGRGFYATVSTSWVSNLTKTNSGAAFTNLQNGGAQQLFPCLESPSVFSLTLKLAPNLTAVSNTPVKSQVYDGIYEFASTDMIRPDNLAFAILNDLEWRKIDNVIYPDVEIYTMSAKSLYHTVVLGLCHGFLEALAKIYPIERQALKIVLVQDFPVDNPGLVLIRENDVAFSFSITPPLQDLYDLNKTLISAVIKQAVKVEDVWYYPGMIQWYQQEVFNSLFPQNRLIVDDLHDILEEERLFSGLSALQPQITSKKSFWIFRMLTNFLTLDDLDNDNPDSISYQWSQQNGYPTLDVHVNATSKAITLSQAEANYRQIPINFATRNNPDFKDIKITHFLKSPIETVTVDSLENQYWLIVNKQQYGYYRVNYDSDNWNRIIDFLLTENYEVINEINRAQIIDDSSHLAEQGVGDYKNYLQLMKYLVNETDPAPLSAFYRSFLRLRVLLTPHSDTYNKLMAYSDSLIGHLYRIASGKPDDSSDIEGLFRIKTLKFLVTLGHKLLHSIMVQVLVNRDDSYDPDFLEASYCGGTKWLTEEQYLDLLQFYWKTGSLTVLKGATCATDPSFLQLLLEAVVLKPTSVQAQHKYSVFISLIEEGPEGSDAVLNFISNRTEEVFTLFSSEEIAIILLKLSRNVVTIEQEKIINKIIEWSKNNQSLDVEIINVIAENIKANFQWTENNLRSIDEYLSDALSTTTLSTSTTTGTPPKPITTPTTPSIVITTPTTPKPSSAINLIMNVPIVFILYLSIMVF